MAQNKEKIPSILSLLTPYKGLIFTLLFLTLVGNALNLILPAIIARGIDAYGAGTFNLMISSIEFSIITVLVFIFTYAQGLIQTYTSEKAAEDLRNQLITKVSEQTYLFVQNTNPAKILTNITADVDSVKTFISQALPSIVSSLVIIIGTSAILLWIDWQLALLVLLVLPGIGITFYVVFKKVRTLFVKSREIIDWLNRVINESIWGAALIRVLNSTRVEEKKFLDANAQARDIGFSIVNLFAAMIPIVTFIGSLATLSILLVGGHFVIIGDMTLGTFSAFNTYLILLIYPIFILGAMSAMIAQSTASYGRIATLLYASDTTATGTEVKKLTGDIVIHNVSLRYEDKQVLRDVSFTIKPGSKNAIIGPTGGGKTQLLYILLGLLTPDTGTITYDGISIKDYLPKNLYEQIGFVFQESSMFNLSIRENIAFNQSVTEESLSKAIATAELESVIAALPEKLETIVSERGTSLSGGQKQRIMLARALALNPRILLLDDFTARVDIKTQAKILENIEKNYPGITLLSVTQKIAPIEHYDQIILVMEGEVLEAGTHQRLLVHSPEYMQIYESQQSTNNYELQS